MNNELIFNFLSQSKFTKRKELLIYLHSQNISISDREMRAEIESMIVDGGYAIASSEKGYSIISTVEQMEKAMKYLDKKAAAIAIRKNCLLRNCKFKIIQENLFA